MGSNPFSALPIKVSIAQRASNIDRIYCGPDCSLILFKNGEIFACGQNNFNKLAFGRKVESVDMFVSSNKFWSVSSSVKNFPKISEKGERPEQKSDWF